LNAAQLVVSHREEPAGTVIEAVGEVDLTTAAQLREALLAAVGTSAQSSIIVDLSKVDFIDSAGLALLVEARKRLSPEGRTMSILLAPGRQPERVLKLGRFDTIMTLAHSLSDLS
jgi:anti-sigma B factor antagonist